MKCLKCETENVENAKFCEKCGESLNREEKVTNKINPPKINKDEVMGYFGYMKNVLLRPFDTFKKECDNFDFKKISIMVGIIAVLLTLISLLSTIIATVRVTYSWTNETKWVWENLKNIDFLKIILHQIINYVGAMFGVAGIYFVGVRVIKKDANFNKLLLATVSMFVPYAVAFILSPLFGMISAYLSSTLMITGKMYALIILIELINDLVVIEDKNTKILFNALCLAIIECIRII